MQTLIESGIDRRERKNIHQRIVFESECSSSPGPSAKFGRGVRQRRSLSPILFNSYGEYLTKDATERFGDFKIGGQVIRTLKYADDLVLLAKEETVLQGVIDRLIDIGRCCGIERNVGEKKLW